MKNNRRTIYFWRKAALCGICAGLAGTFSACDKNLLDTVPKTQVLTNNMWKTDNLTDQGVNGVYQALRLGQMLYVYDSYVTLQNRDRPGLLNGNINSSNGLFQDTWRTLYEGIHRTNNAIYGIANISPVGDEKKARLTAEMKFLRAYGYYRLNQLYRGVPIYVEPIEWDKVDKARNSEQEVWDQIIADLTDCINETALPDRYPAGNGNFGHATKSAAYALRGKTYLYTQEWAKAVADFEQVKNLGHSLFPDYADLFREANEQSPEIIFSIQNMPLNGYGSDYQFRFGSRSAFGSNWNTYLVRPDAVDRYPNADGTPFNWDDHLPGYNAMDPAKREVFFLRNNLTAAEITEFADVTKKGLDMSLYLPNGNEQRLASAYANRDPRLAANVILPYSTFVGANGAADGTFTARWPHRREFDNGNAHDLRTDQTTRFYYYPRKFVYEGANPGIPNRTSGGYDYIVLRYADILLCWAEALNELHDPATAVQKVNEVRARAGVAALPSGISEADLREEIREEKRRELIGEGQIFFDELRWKTWRETTFYAGNGIKAVWGTSFSPYVWPGDHLYTWPVPQVERERNTALTQNPGWDD